MTAYQDVVQAYQGVERLDNFTGDQLAAYRRELLDRTDSQAAFIVQHAPPDVSILEIGAGNGRLLITLAQRRLLREGLGIDISTSRIEFARKWAQDLGLDQIRFDVADALTTSLPGQVDVILCITGTFAYFDAIQPNAGAQLLKHAHGALKPEGLLVLELYPHAVWRRMLEIAENHELRLWHELPRSDPWRFYLSHLRFSPSTQILTHHKTFLHRSADEVDDDRQEHIRLYDQPSIDKELRAAGYSDIACYGDWNGRGNQPEDERLIVTAHRS